MQIFSFLILFITLSLALFLSNPITSTKKNLSCPTIEEMGLCVMQGQGLLVVVAQLGIWIDWMGLQARVQWICELIWVAWVAVAWGGFIKNWLVTTIGCGMFKWVGEIDNMVFSVVK